MDSAPAPASGPAPLPEEAAARAVASLVARHGAAQADAIRRGIGQVARRWWPEDGDAESFVAFCEANYLADEGERAAAFARLEAAFEQLDGHLLELRRELSRPVELDLGPVRPVDSLLQNVELSAHLDDDLYGSKVAFFALLNFPVHTLKEKRRHGAAWDREAWARARLLDRFAERVPAAAVQESIRARHAAAQYVDAYNIRMDRLTTPEGRGLFPEGLSLITHWGLRDDLKSRYAEGASGLPRQRMIQRVMERIVSQEIPAAVRGNGDLVWCPVTNQVAAAPGAPAPAADVAAREPDTRYRRILELFRAERGIDRHTPETPTFIRRKFDRDRELPERDVEALLISILSAGELTGIADRIRTRLGRPLEPFDLWYPGFQPRGTHVAEALDRIVGERYPTVEAFQADLPRILEQLGFAPDRARWVADRIVVDPSRGAGHAMPAARREDKAHLRTRIPSDGMRYQGFNVAMHELGHNVEQVFSLHAIDHTSLRGVPGTGFTEAFAFLFQARDLEVLGMPGPGEEARRLTALHELWVAYEIAGVSLVDMRTWNWLYANPDATPESLREAVRRLARDVWNEYFAPIFGVRDVELLAVYAHMVVDPLYLPDYAIGRVIAFQIGRRLREGNFGDEVERMTRLGCLTPDAWMRAAVGGPISAEALIDAARESLRDAPHEAGAGAVLG